MPDATYGPKVYRKDGGNTQVVASGGVIAVETGGDITVNGVSLIDEVAALSGLDSGELGVLNGVTPGTVTAGKAVVTTTDKHIDALVISDGGLALGSGAGTAVTSTAAELNYNDITTLGTGAASKAVVLDAGEDYTWPATGVLTYGVLKDPAATTLTATAAELNLLDDSVAGTSVASKALVLGADKNTDVLALPVSGLKIGAGAGTAVDRTAAEINGLAQGVAAGYKIARSAAPVSLDGGNPTSFAHGLTTCLSVTVQLVGSDAPGLNTSVLTAVINGANVDVYAWKPTGQLDTTLIASTGTETFNWIAVGT